MTYATPTDVAALLARELDTAETALAERRLEQVERMILRRIPDLTERAEDESYLADLTDIEAEAVYRVLRNPDGVIAEGDGTYNYQRSAEAADNRLRLASDEWSVLGVRAGKMFGIAPGIGGVAL